MRIFGAELSTKRPGYPQLNGGYPQFGREGTSELCFKLAANVEYLYLPGDTGVPIRDRLNSEQGSWERRQKCRTYLAYTGTASL